MICIFCKGKVAKQKVQEDIQVGSDHMVVEVEAEVCENCHERYYPQGTADRLLALKRQFKTDKNRLKPIGQVYQAVA